MAAGVEITFDLGLKLDFKIAVLFVGDEEGVGASFGGGSGDHSVFDLIGGESALDRPSGEIFSVEGFAPFASGRRERECE